MNDSNRREIISRRIDEICSSEGAVNVDKNDFHSMFDGLTIEMAESCSQGADDRVAAALEPLASLDLEHIGHAILIFSMNHDLTPPLKVQELNEVNNFVGMLRDDVSLVWGLQYDDSLPTDKFCVTLFYSLEA